MKITNENYLIGYVGENLTRTIEYTFESELDSWSKHIEFQKANGEKITSKELSSNSSSFDIPYELLKDIGNLDAQLVAINNEGLIKKSPIKTFYISQSINATEELIESESDWKVIGDIYTQLHEKGTALEFEEGTNILKLIGKDSNGNVVVLSQIQIPNSIIGDLTKYYTKEETIQYINENVLNRVNSLENSYQEFSNKLNELEKSNSELSGKVNELDNLVDVMEENVNNIDKDLEENKNRVVILEDNFNVLNEKSKNHDTNIHTLNENVNDLNIRVQENKIEIENVDKKVESFEDDLSKLSGNITTLGTNVSTLGNKVNDMDEKVDEASEKVNTFENTFNQLDKKVDTFDSRIINVENKVNEFGTSLNDFDTRFTNVENNNNIFYNKVNEFEKEINDFEDNLRELGTNVSDLGTNIIKIQNDIKEIEDKNSTQEQKINNLENNSASKQFVYDNTIIKYNVNQTTSDIKKDVVYDVLQNREIGTYLYNNIYLVGKELLYSNYYTIVVFDTKYNEFYKVEHIQKNGVSSASEISLTEVYSKIENESVTIEKLAKELANKINNSANKDELNDIYLSLTNKNNELNDKIDNETIKQYIVDTNDYGVYNSIAYDILIHKKVGTYLYNEQYLATKIDNYNNTFNIVVENLLDKERYSIYEISGNFSDSPSRLELYYTPSPQDEIQLKYKDEIFGTLSYGINGNDFGLWSNMPNGKLVLGNYKDDKDPYIHAVDYSSEGFSKFISFGSGEDGLYGDQELIPISFTLDKDCPEIWLKNTTYINHEYVFSDSFRVGDSYDETYGFLSCNKYGSEIGLYSYNRNPIALFDNDLGTPYLYCYHNDNDNLYVMFGGDNSPETYENPIMFDINESNPDIYIKDRSIISELDNINAKLDNLPVFESEVSTFSYKQGVPHNALDYSLVEEIGGMSYESGNLLIADDIEETTTDYGVTYSFKNGILTINGTSTATSATKILIPLKTPLLKGIYTLRNFVDKSNAISNDTLAIVSFNGWEPLLSFAPVNQTVKTQEITDLGYYFMYYMPSAKTYNNYKVIPMITKGSIVPTTFEQGYSGFYNAKVERVTFEQKNLIPKLSEYQMNTHPAGYYEMFTDGSINIKKTTTNQMQINIFKVGFNNAINPIPKGKAYSMRVVFENTLPQNIGAFVITYDSSQDKRVATITYDSNRNAYYMINQFVNKDIDCVYLYISQNIEVDNVRFKVELVENSFMNDSIIIPSEVQALEGYGLGVDNNNYNYIRYNEDSEQYEFVKNVDSYTFTGNENIFQVNTYHEGKYRYQFDDLKGIIQAPPDANNKGVIKFEILENNTANYSYMTRGDCGCIDGFGSVLFYVSSIQTIDEMKAYLTGKTIIYKLATPEVSDISEYMNDEYLQVQENGVVKFENEKQKVVPNKITYAIKVV